MITDLKFQDDMFSFPFWLSRCNNYRITSEPRYYYISIVVKEDMREQFFNMLNQHLATGSTFVCVFCIGPGMYIHMPFFYSSLPYKDGYSIIPIFTDEAELLTDKIPYYMELVDVYIPKTKKEVIEIVSTKEYTKYLSILEKDLISYIKECNVLGKGLPAKHHSFITIAIGKDTCLLYGRYTNDVKKEDMVKSLYITKENFTDEEYTKILDRMYKRIKSGNLKVKMLNSKIACEVCEAYGVSYDKGDKEEAFYALASLLYDRGIDIDKKELDKLLN